MDGIAQQTTASSILSEVHSISGNVEELVQINRSVRYYNELPQVGTDGYVYITTDGIYYYDGTLGEYISCAGNSGDLNGFSFALDSENRVVMNYANPEDETDTATAVLATATTGNEIIGQIRQINASILLMITEGSDSNSNP